MFIVCQLALCLGLQDYYGAAAVSSEQGPSCKPTLKLQASVALEEYTTPPQGSYSSVSYRLVTIIFRTGGLGSAHFFVALQSSPNHWLVYNSAVVTGPFTLDDVQAKYGDYVYGVAYLRSERPEAGDRQSLFAWLQKPENADTARYVQTDLN